MFMGFLLFFVWVYYEGRFDKYVSREGGVFIFCSDVFTLLALYLFVFTEITWPAMTLFHVKQTPTAR